VLPGLFLGWNPAEAIEAVRTGAIIATSMINFFMLCLKKLRINKIYRRSKAYL
jgi:hypothetical protein